jgi:hypothetical protein
VIRIARRLAAAEATLAAMAPPPISDELQQWLDALTNDEALALDGIYRRSAPEGAWSDSDQALAEVIAEAVEARLAGLDVKSIV